MKDALVATTAVAGVASAVEGVRFSRTAPGGAVPLRDGDHVAAGASPAAGALKPRLHALGAVTLAAEAGLVVVNAALAQEGFRRPPAPAAGPGRGPRSAARPGAAAVDPAVVLLEQVGEVHRGRDVQQHAVGEEVLELGAGRAGGSATSS